MKKIYKNLKTYTKIEKAVITFGVIEIEKQKSNQYKRSTSITNIIDINKIAVLFLPKNECI